MTSAFSLLLLLATLCGTALHVAHAMGKNPCHDNKRSLGDGVTCTKVVIPPMMCANCRMKPIIKHNGAFADCKSIYDLTDKECQRQVRYYADRNKNCDPIRAKQVMDFNNPANVEGLDYFLYSVCEQCCDCVPRGAKVEEWYSRKRAGTNLLANRGNCPAHAWYDITLIWPKVKFVSPPRGMADDTEAKELKPMLKNWFNTPANKDWLLQGFTEIEPGLERFFKRFFKVVQCQRSDIWVPCVNLETAQKRLWFPIHSSLPPSLSLALSHYGMILFEQGRRRCTQSYLEILTVLSESH